jgi:hypothetical protein
VSSRVAIHSHEQVELSSSPADSQIQVSSLKISVELDGTWFCLGIERNAVPGDDMLVKMPVGRVGIGI